MKFSWARSVPPLLQRIANDEGLVLAVSPDVCAAWWVAPDQVDQALRPATSYLGQLVNEGRAALHRGALLLSWDALFRLLKDADHAAGLRLLENPVVGDWAP